MIEFIKEFQTLIAGILAIGAGWLAYKGAIQQAKTTIDIEKMRADGQRRTTAAAFWAELTYCNLQLKLEADNLRSISGEKNILRMTKCFYTPTFDASPESIGLLSAFDAYSTTSAYMSIKVLDEHLQSLKKGSSALDLENQRHSIVHLVSGSRPTVVNAISHLAIAAGLDSKTTERMEEYLQNMEKFS